MIQWRKDSFFFLVIFGGTIGHTYAIKKIKKKDKLLLMQNLHHIQTQDTS
jgi:hypothetical protein